MIPDFLKAEVAEYDLNLIAPPESVLDIGANVGAFTMRAAQLWPKARIFAYEPLPANAAQFRLHCQSPRITFQEAAIRSFDGESEIRVGDMGVTASFHELGRQTPETITVKCRSAASLPACEFVKIDTEGCELEILQTLPLDQTKALVCEYHRQSDVEPIKAIARAAGLEMVIHIRHPKNVGLLKFARIGVVKEVPKIFLGLPIYGAMDAQFAECLIHLHLDPPCNDFLVCPNRGDSLVSRSRNTITANFLGTDATHLLWLDSDLIFSPDHVKRIISHDRDVVGGFYPKKAQGPVQWVVNALDGGVDAPIDANGLQEIKYAGTGFMLIKRPVFEQMIERFGHEIGFTADESGRQEYDFWSVGVYQFPDGTRRHLSEDWFFCQRWKDLGGKIWGDTKIVAKHVGQAVYPLKTQEVELGFCAPPK